MIIIQLTTCPSRLGSGRPTNVITDGAQESDEDEQFIVEDNTPLQTKSSLVSGQHENEHFELFFEFNIQRKLT